MHHWYNQNAETGYPPFDHRFHVKWHSIRGQSVDNHQLCKTWLTINEESIYEHEFCGKSG